MTNNDIHAPLTEAEEKTIHESHAGFNAQFKEAILSGLRTFTDLNPKKEELCLCYPINEVRKVIAQFGDVPFAWASIATALDAHAEIRPRKFLEDNKDYVHAIVYFALRKGDRIGFYNRGKTGGEEKLSNKASCGFGGHINMYDFRYYEINQHVDLEEGITLEQYVAAGNKVDVKPTICTLESIKNAFRRELEEELELPSYSGDERTDVYTSHITHKVIFQDVDDDNGVHRAHIGFLGTVHIPEWLDDNSIVCKEGDFLGWYPLEEKTLDQFEKVELWSKVFFRSFIDGTDFGYSVDMADKIRRIQFNQASNQLQQEHAQAAQYAEMLSAQMEGHPLQEEVQGALQDALDAASRDHDELIDFDEESEADVESVEEASKA